LQEGRDFFAMSIEAIASPVAVALLEGLPGEHLFRIEVGVGFQANAKLVIGFEIEIQCFPGLGEDGDVRLAKRLLGAGDAAGLGRAQGALEVLVRASEQLEQSPAGRSDNGVRTSDGASNAQRCFWGTRRRK
jgi:hypothetical protein